MPTDWKSANTITEPIFCDVCERPTQATTLLEMAFLGWRLQLDRDGSVSVADCPHCARPEDAHAILIEGPIRGDFSPPKVIVDIDI